MGAAHERWVRTEGVMVAPGLRAAEVQQHLAAASVVARLEWYPSTEHLLSVTVASDESGRVAITPPSRGGVVPGPALGDLVRELGEAFGADVLMDGASFTTGHAAPADPARSADRPDPWVEHDARTVVLTRLPQHALPLHADLLRRPLSVLEHAGYRLVMTAGPGRELGSYGWDEEAFPVLRLQVDAEDRTATLLAAGEETAVYSWEMTSTVVHGHVTTPGPALRTMTEVVLGDRADAHAFSETLGVPVDEVAAAMATPGAAGLAAFVSALGLPPVVTEVLEGRIPPAEVPGAVRHEPRGLGNAVGRSMSYLLADESLPGSRLWRAYRRTVLERPWLVRALAATEVAVGSVLVARARRVPTPGRRAAAVLGVGLLLDAAADLSLARVVRRTSATVR